MRNSRASLYGSYVAINLGESISKIKMTVQKKFKKKK